MSASKKFTLTLSKKQTQDRITLFYFSTNEKIPFNAGQYLQLTLPHDSDERGTTRFFSIASSPQEKYIIFVTKKPSTSSGKTISSFKKMLFALEKGDSVEAFGPMGSFTF